MFYPLSLFVVQNASGDCLSSVINNYLTGIDTISTGTLLQLKRKDILQTVANETITTKPDIDVFLVSSWGGFNVDYISQPSIIFQVTSSAYRYYYSPDN